MVCFFFKGVQRTAKSPNFSSIFLKGNLEHVLLPPVARKLARSLSLTLTPSLDRSIQTRTRTRRLFSGGTVKKGVLLFCSVQLSEGKKKCLPVRLVSVIYRGLSVAARRCSSRVAGWIPGWLPDWLDYVMRDHRQHSKSHRPSTPPPDEHVAFSFV